MRNQRLWWLLLAMVLLAAPACSLNSQRAVQLQSITPEAPQGVQNQPVVIDARTNPNAVDVSAQQLPGEELVVPRVEQDVYAGQAGTSGHSGGGAGIGGGSGASISSGWYHQPTYHIPTGCSPRHHWSTYIVQRGDTLTRIAIRFGTTVYQLAVANCLSNPNRIYAGQRLKVPSYSHPNPPPPPPPNVRYEGRVIPHPFIATNGYSYAVNGGSVIALNWQYVNLSGVHRVEFYYTPSYSPAILVGTDTYLADGASASWAVPTNASGYVTAAGFGYGGNLVVRTAYETFVYAQSYQPPTPYPPTQPPPLNTALSFTPYTQVNNGVYTLPVDQFIIIRWETAFPSNVNRVEFVLQSPTGGSVVMGVDHNVGDGGAIQWFAVTGTQGTVTGYAYFSDGHIQSSSSYYIIVPPPFFDGAQPATALPFEDVAASVPPAADGGVPLPVDTGGGDSGGAVVPPPQDATPIPFMD